MKKLKLLFIISLMVLHVRAQESDCAPFIISAFEDFNAVEKKDHVPFYKEKRHKALAVNAAEYKSQFALASHIFKKEKGKYDIAINTFSETDGECTYKVFVKEKLVSKVQNKPTNEDYAVQTFDCGTVQLKPGDTIRVAFNTHTNGKIPEGETTAYARGRWTGLKITPVCK
ncbi:MAG: hypothetical protein WEB30_18095 [Cyclobacteriaceae bacterium]